MDLLLNNKLYSVDLKESFHLFSLLLPVFFYFFFITHHMALFQFVQLSTLNQPEQAHISAIS